MMFAKDDAKKKISILSGGEKSRVLLGKILAKPCNLLLLDEPTNHLDMESIESLLESLEEFFGAVVIVTHSEMILNRLSLDKLIICHKKEQTFFRGNYEEFLEKKGWPEDCLNKKEKKELKFQKAKKNGNGNLKKEIKILENKIITLETNLKKEEQILMTASEKGNKENIIKFSKITSNRREEIDDLFAKLEKLSKECIEKKEES